jgi:hypothetical protein
MFLRLLKSGALAALVSAAAILLAVLISALSIWFHATRNQSGIVSFAGGISGAFAASIAAGLVAIFLFSFWYFWKHS